jgi:long-chain fatty acid transport protein
VKNTLARILPWTLMTGSALAAGYYLPNQDAFATGKGNAFVATSDSPAAVFYNPAGLTQLNHTEAEVGVYSIILGSHVSNAFGTYDAKSQLQSIPQIYFATPVNDRVVFGFGVNSPFGLGSSWGQDTSFRTVISDVKLVDVSATPAVAWKVSDEFSLGASVSGNFQDMSLGSGVGFGPGDYLRFQGSGTSVSGSLSARWQPSEQHAFGLVYSSGSSSDLRGKLYSNYPLPYDTADLKFMTPQRIAAGYSYRPAPGWNVEADIEWLGWEKLNSLRLTGALPGGGRDLVFDWKSGFIYELGVSHISECGWVVAAGYDFNANVQPDANFNPGVSDANRHWFNTGFGQRKENHSWFLAYQFGFSDRTVDGASNPLANGKYESRHNAIMLSWEQRF